MQYNAIQMHNTAPMGWVCIRICAVCYVLCAAVRRVPSQLRTTDDLHYHFCQHAASFMEHLTSSGTMTLWETWKLLSDIMKAEFSVEVNENEMASATVCNRTSPRIWVFDAGSVYVVSLSIISTRICVATISSLIPILCYAVVPHSHLHVHVHTCLPAYSQSNYCNQCNYCN
jgi:hypothetical protein